LGGREADPGQSQSALDERRGGVVIARTSLGVPGASVAVECYAVIAGERVDRQVEAAEAVAA